MIWLIFTLIYIISFAIHIVNIWYEYKRHIFKVGDIIDHIQFYMLCPVINTGVIIILIPFLIFVSLEKLWKKFRDIKIKK